MSHQTAAMDSTDSAEVTSGDQSAANIRRRLGSWTAPAAAQTTPIAKQSASTIELDSGGGETMPLSAEAASVMGTVQSLRASITGGLPAAPSADLNTMPLGSSGPTQGLGLTAPMSGDPGRPHHLPSHWRLPPFRWPPSRPPAT